MRADHVRVTEPGSDLGGEYRDILDAYERAGMPFERALTRLSYARWLEAAGNSGEARVMAAGALALCRRHGMAVLEVDALELQADLGETNRAALAAMREACGYRGRKRV